jgi:hypothetical protein
LIRLKPINHAKLRTSFNDPNEEIEFGNGGEQMAKDVHVGNNVAVKCEFSSDEDFRILLCDKGLHMIQQG